MSTVLQLRKQLVEQPQTTDAEGFVIRCFNDRDLENWLKLRQTAFSRERVGVRSWQTADFEREFRHKWWWDPAKMWLAEPQNEPFSGLAGAVTLAMRGTPQHATPVVHWLMVAPAARRRGIGQTLMAHLEVAVWESGQREICLETHAGWEKALRFYESLGFRPDRTCS